MSENGSKDQLNASWYSLGVRFTPVYNRILVKNTIFLTFGNAIAKACGFVLTVLMARKLGAEQFGLFFTALAWSAIAFQAGAFGLDILLKRDLPRKLQQTRKYLANALALRLVLSAIVVLLLLLITSRIDRSSQAALVFSLVAAFYAIDLISNLVLAVFEAHELMEYEAAIILLRSILTLAFGAWALYSGLDVVMVAAVYVVIGTLALLAAFGLLSRKIVKLSLEFDFGFWKSMVSTSYVWALMTLLLMLNLRMDSALLSILSTAEDVGLYNSAHSITSGLGFVPAAITNAFFPGLTRRFIHDRQQATVQFHRLLVVNIVVGLLLSIPLVVLANPIMRILYSNAYAEVSMSLRILAAGLFLSFIYSACGVMLNAINREKRLLIIISIAFVVNAALNVLLIPRYGYDGASVAKLSTDVTVAVTSFWLVARATSMKVASNRGD